MTLNQSVIKRRKKSSHKKNTKCHSHGLGRTGDDAPLQEVLHTQEDQDGGHELLGERHGHRTRRQWVVVKLLVAAKVSHKYTQYLAAAAVDLFLLHRPRKKRN